MFQPESLLRIVLAIMAVALFANHHVFHRRKSRRPKRQQITRLEVLLMTVAWTWTMSLVLFISGWPWFDSLMLPIPFALRVTGIGLMIVCLPLAQWTYAVLGEHFSKKLELRQGHELITRGPYYLVRHPMYATLFLCALGTCLVSANIVVTACVVFIVPVFFRRMRNEEQMLMERFGEEYCSYKQRTGAIVPRLGTMFAWCRLHQA